MEMGWQFAAVMIVFVMLYGVVRARMDRARGITPLGEEPKAAEVAGEIEKEPNTPFLMPVRFEVVSNQDIRAWRSLPVGIRAVVLRDVGTGVEYLVLEGGSGVAAIEIAEGGR